MRTLFGIVETKTESRERAKKLCKLYSALREAPVAIECRQGQIGDLDYFIDKAKKKKFDPNVRDGLGRLIGDPEEVLTDRDCAQMRRNKKLWRKTPAHMRWYAAGEYCITLHPKEIKFLEDQKLVLADEVEAIKASVPEIRQEITELRLIGLLPENIAERYKLTTDGQEKHEPEKRSAPGLDAARTL